MAVPKYGEKAVTPMSQFDEYDDDVDEQQEQQATAPKALRDALKAQKDENQKLKEQLDKLLSAQAEASLTGILTAKGVSPKIAKFLKADKVELTDEAVQKWLDENADVFNIKTEKPANDADKDDTEDEAPTQPQDQGDPLAGLPDDVKQALAALQNSQALEVNAGSTGVEDSDLSAALSAVGDTAVSFDDAAKALKALGAPII